MRGVPILMLAGLFLQALFVPIARADRASDEAVRDFRAIRALIWGVDSNSGAVKGFSEAEVLPRKSATLKPDAATSFVWTNATVSATGEPAIVFKLNGPHVEYNELQSLVRPGMITVFRSADTTIRYVVLSLPLGSLKSPSVERFSEAKMRGDRMELEDIFISFARDKAVDADKLMWMCSILQTSARLSDWTSLAADQDADVAALGLAAAARLGDAPSLERFCEKCVTAKLLNDQIPLANLLMEMPKDHRVLGAMLSMAALPDPLVYPGAGCGDTRFELAETVQKNYPSEEIRARANALIGAASAHGDPELAERLKDVIARIDRFAEAQAARPQPVEGVSLEERMRNRRNENAATQPALDR